MRSYARRWTVICFYCLREVSYKDATIVEHEFPPLGTKLRVYACSDCAAKRATAGH